MKRRIIILTTALLGSGLAFAQSSNERDYPQDTRPQCMDRTADPDQCGLPGDGVVRRRPVAPPQQVPDTTKKPETGRAFRDGTNSNQPATGGGFRSGATAR